MIITVTLNAAIDKTLEVPSFTPGRRHRTVDQTTMPGGKGVNIARAIKRLGQPVIVTGFAGGATGSRIIEALDGESILNDFVRIDDESRTNTAVLDPTTGVHTEINERGPAVSAGELEQFREKLVYLAQGASICVFAGSIPRGVAPDIYYSLIRDVHRLGVTTMIDAEGEPLRLSMRAEPALVSPNELEAEELVGHEFNDADDQAGAVAEMVRLGSRTRGGRPSTGSPSPSRRSAPRSARATRSSPGMSRRATAARPRSTACGSGWPAARSRRSISALGSSTRGASSGCSARWGASGSRRPPRSTDQSGVAGDQTPAGCGLSGGGPVAVCDASD
jgi:1-phosphofructokinase family hexose kinase